ncbi:phage baseplate assembly protein V [Pseudomonas aeruginosa]|uniref:phage baseplate assembly protein V n=1 Tax=Pseudomonas aeruginosa TaxID=287 RepID=UPI000E31F5F5|nr:phage baseplate assembly protein V [Pseudomonas aeruginosa]NPZ19516.1 phage baseplate assembly protein V [Pseudomonas aeruginosa]
MFDAYLRIALAPILDRLLELEAEIDDLQRRAEGQARLGTITSVDTAAGTCEVSHGELTSPHVKYFQPAAGEVADTRHPSVGEQCLLINYGGGDGSAQAVALCGLPRDSFPLASTVAELVRRTYPDGTESSYDHAAHALNWKNGQLSVKADREGVVVMLGAVGFKVTAAGFSHIGGTVDHDGKNIGKDHAHLNSGGPSIGGVPA